MAFAACVPVRFTHIAGGEGNLGCLLYLNQQVAGERNVTGTVQSYIPSVLSGIIQADNGERLRFELGPCLIDLHGGDIVEFERSGNGRAVAVNVVLRLRGVDLLNERNRALVNEFHHTVHIEA